MSGTEVAKFDPNSYVDKVRDKIKQSLIDVIPDEQWNVMLKAEIGSFFENRVTSNYGQQTQHPSEFRRIVGCVLEEETKKRVRELLTGPEWASYWDGTKMNVGNEIGRIARENGAAILAKWLEAAIAQVIDGLKFQQ